MVAIRDKELILQTLETLKGVEKRPEDLKFFVGFDGFVDEIIHVVDKRVDFETYTRVDTIAQFGDRISRAPILNLFRNRLSWVAMDRLWPMLCATLELS